MRHRAHARLAKGIELAFIHEWPFEMLLGTLNGVSLRLSPRATDLRQEFEIEGIRPDGRPWLYGHVLGMYRSIRDRMEAEEGSDEGYGSATELNKAYWGFGADGKQKASKNQNSRSSEL